MSNPVRLGRYAFGADNVTQKQRMLFTERRKRKPLWLPLIFGALFLYFVVLPAFADEREVAAGVTKGGMSFYISRSETSPLLEFHYYVTTERR